MVAIKQLVRTALDRPAGRWLLALRGTALASLRNRRLCRVAYGAGGWVHRYRDGVLVNGTLTMHTPDRLDTIARDICCWDYTPREGDTVIDVGAGIGTEVLTFSRQVGPSGHVVAVEAHPATFRCLQRMVELNRLENVTPVHCALSDEPGVVRISDLDAHLSNTVLDDDGGIEVPALTLDALAEEHGLERIDYIKMNIEGAEALAVPGMEPVIAGILNLCISCHDFKADETGIEAMRTKAQIAMFLRAHGYTIRTRPDDPRRYVRDYVYATRRDSGS